MWIRAFLVLTLAASCNKGPSCEDHKREAIGAIHSARGGASNVAREQGDFDAADKRLEEARTFERKVIAGLSVIRSEHGCPPKPELVCCANAAKWIEAHAKVPEGERPLWRLPAFGESKGAPAAWIKDLAAYDAAASKLSSLLQKGKDAPLAEVTALCEQANTAITGVRTAAPELLQTATAAAQADRSTRLEVLALAKSRGEELARWEDSVTRDARFEVGPPSPTEPTPMIEARAKAQAVQSCLK